jgi:SsrA-binding protein
MAENALKTIARNKKAWHDYSILDMYEAGIVLTGTEVKSIRKGNLNMKDCYAKIESGEMFIEGMHISPYEQGNIFNVDPLRRRKLLMHKHEIMKLYARVKQDGLTLIPLSIYFKKGKMKVEVGIAKGKKTYDKREDLARREANRSIERAFKNN